MPRVVKDLPSFGNCQCALALLGATDHKKRVNQKIVLLGVVAGVVCLWLMLTWEPVSQDEPVDAAPAADQDPPSLAPVAPPTAALKAVPPTPDPPKQAPAPSEEPAHDPAPEQDPTTPKSNFVLEKIPDQQVDMANLPPPSASGPREALQKEFESAARDSSSSELEKTIEEGFKMDHVAPELLEAVVCHGSVCRVRTRWTPERAGGFTIAMTKLAVKVVGDPGSDPLFERNFAVGQASERNSNGERTLDVYFRKNQAQAK
jgi:type IV secretory pathway VirB10-like protein